MKEKSLLFIMFLSLLLFFIVIIGGVFYLLKPKGQKVFTRYRQKTIEVYDYQLLDDMVNNLFAYSDDMELIDFKPIETSSGAIRVIYIFRKYEVVKSEK